jgi:hypothetical protein
MMNFIIRVMENNGSLSEEEFGKPGTEYKVENGIFTSLTRFRWGSFGPAFNNVKSINKRLNSRKHEYNTVFVLVEEEPDEDR